MSEYIHTTQPPPPTGEAWGTSNDEGWKSTGRVHHNSCLNQSNRLPTSHQIRHSSSNVEPNPNLYIHNVPKDATEEELKDLFSTFGTVERIRLKVNQKIGPQALYAFVTFSSTNEAQLALQRLNGYDMRSRLLRIEFQRSREDEFRLQPHHDSSSATSPDNYCGSSNLVAHDTSRGTADVGATSRRKRNQGFETGALGDYGETLTSAYVSQMSPPAYESREPMPLFKRTRHIEGAMSAQDEAARNIDIGREKYSQATQVTHQPTTIFLCEVLHNIRSDLFENSGEVEPFSNKPYPIASSIQTASSDYKKLPAVSFCSNAPPPPPPPPLSYAKTPHALTEPTRDVMMREPVKTLTVGEVLWKGNLVRNGKKKVLVDVCYLNGSPISHLSPSLKTLNISHRSSWDDLLKKTITTVCFVQLSSVELLSNGKTAPINAHRLETSKKFLKEHLQYLTDKQRAGVVTFPNNSHLYLVPPGTALFTKFSAETDALSKTNEIILGLFVTGSSNTNSSLPTDQQTTSVVTGINGNADALHNWQQSNQVNQDDQQYSVASNQQENVLIQSRQGHHSFQETAPQRSFSHKLQSFGGPQKQ